MSSSLGRGYIWVCQERTDDDAPEKERPKVLEMELRIKSLPSNTPKHASRKHPSWLGVAVSLPKKRVKKSLRASKKAMLQVRRKRCDESGPMGHSSETLQWIR
mmetsp:Transcript_3814/g.7071  ORF Transcript_3814/g.7071 Transcript_3814/m.7071 type:complete len:103 (-) Transcript_3814:493-801(-)